MVKSVLVTGCSSGIGRATAEAFLGEGWQVYATTRDPANCSRFDTDSATVLTLDVTSQTDVDRVVEQIGSETGRIDCLVNNAGYGQFGPLEDVPAEAVRDQFEVNVFGAHRLARAVLPRMREQGSGTIINISSIDDRLPLAGIGAYNGSKYALAGMSGALRQEVADQGVEVVVIEPGLVATEFYDRALAALPEDDRTAAYENVYEVLERVGIFRDDILGVCEPSTVADVIVKAATTDSPDPRYQVGATGKGGLLAAKLLPRTVRDTAVRAGINLAATVPVQRFLHRIDDRRSSQ